MKYINIQLMLIVLLIGITGNPAQAQLLETKSEIIAEYGQDYETGTTNSGRNYIIYELETTTEISGTYTLAKVFYFTELDDGEEICTLWKQLEPSSETNYNVSLLRDNYVEIDDMQWKDYENGVIYEIEVDREERVVITSVYLD